MKIMPLKPYKDENGVIHALKCGCNYEPKDGSLMMWTYDTEHWEVVFPMSGEQCKCGYWPWYTMERNDYEGG